MTTYTITGPDGRDYSIDGPAGATQEQVIAQIQKNMPGGGMPSHEEVNQGLGSIRQRLIANLLPAHNPSSYSPYKPADPQHMPNDAINPMGTDAQMGQAIGTAGMGAMAGPRANTIRPPTPPPAPPPAPTVPPVNMGQMPTQASKAMEWAQNMGTAPGATRGAGLPTQGGVQPPSPPASTIPSNPITTAPPLPGTDPLQASLLHAAIHYLPRMLGMH